MMLRDIVADLRDAEFHQNELRSQALRRIIPRQVASALLLSDEESKGRLASAAQELAKLAEDYRKREVPVENIIQWEMLADMLWHVIDKPQFGPVSKLLSEETISARVFRSIVSEPGITRRELMKAERLGEPHVSNALTKLEKAGMIFTLRKEGSAQSLYPSAWVVDHVGGSFRE